MANLELKMKDIAVYSKVKFSQLRLTILSVLRNLSNKEQQLNEWVDPNYAHSFWDTLRFSDEFLKDIELNETPEETIGTHLVDQQECDVIKPVYRALDNLYQQIGADQPDSVYITSPLWDDVVEAAQAAFKIFIANEEKAHKINPHPLQGEEDWLNVKP